MKNKMMIAKRAVEVSKIIVASGAGVAGWELMMKQGRITNKLIAGAVIGAVGAVGVAGSKGAIKMIENKRSEDIVENIIYELVEEEITEEAI